MRRLLMVVMVGLLFSAVAMADPLVDIYSGHSTTGGGAPYSGLVGSFNSADILFATDTSYNWHPFGLSNFGADITGNLLVSSNGTYSFTLNSDDGSLLYIDGLLVVNNGGPHPPTVVTSSAALTAGIHPFEVQFFEDFGGPSGVDLYLPRGVNYAPVPEPASLMLLGSGLLSAGWFTRRRIKS